MGVSAVTMRIEVTDHALLRYIERAHGISLDPLRKEIERIVREPALAGASTVTVNGFTYCLVQHGSNRVTVTTVITNEMRQKQVVKNRRNRFRGSNRNDG